MNRSHEVSPKFQGILVTRLKPTLGPKRHHYRHHRCLLEALHLVSRICFEKIANTRVMIYIYIHTISCWSQPLPSLTRRPVTQTRKNQCFHTRPVTFHALTKVELHAQVMHGFWMSLAVVKCSWQCFCYMVVVSISNLLISLCLSLWLNRLQGWHSGSAGSVHRFIHSLLPSPSLLPRSRSARHSSHPLRLHRPGRASWNLW